MPSNTASSVFFYINVLESLKDNMLYIGYTNNLKRRMEEHKKGLSFATKYRLPFKLIYSEACTNEQGARRREHYLKTTRGRIFLSLRLKEYRHQKASGSGS
jgi:putative endonuclease